jgi:uncharacterized protein (DUF924 family)
MQRRSAVLTERAASPGDIVAFWREAGEEKWFNKDEAFDRHIAERFAALHADAVAGRLADWAETPEGALALILLLDQFSRNLFRGKPQAFAQDAMAVDLARMSLDAGHDKSVDPTLRMFFCMPFMHSETIAAQRRCVCLFHRLVGATEGLKYALEHAEIIRRFGRFPHRNAILGRHTTPAERSFLDGGGFAG